MESLIQNEIFVKHSEKLTVEIKFVVVLCLYVANRQFGHRISHRTWIKYVFEWAAWRRRAVAFEFVEGEGGFGLRTTLWVYLHFHRNHWPHSMWLPSYHFTINKFSYCTMTTTLWHAYSKCNHSSSSSTSIWIFKNSIKLICRVSWAQRQRHTHTHTHKYNLHIVRFTTAIKLLNFDCCRSLMQFFLAAVYLIVSIWIGFNLI